MSTHLLFLRYFTPNGDKYVSLDSVLAFGNAMHHGNHDGNVYEQFGDLYLPVKTQSPIHIKESQAIHGFAH